MTTVGAALRLGAGRLAEGFRADPVPGASALDDARRLMAHALDIAPDRVLLAEPDPVDAGTLRRFDAAIRARLARQPVAQIVGYRWFHGHRFVVSPDTLDPRPETELLVDLALTAPGRRILDLGTGTGCVLLSVLAGREEATGLGTDLSASALEVARRNAGAMDLTRRAAFRQADWWQGVEGRFDLILSNPPYIAAAEMDALSPDVRNWEPVRALTDGADGLNAYREIACDVACHLAPGGQVLVEIGPTQAEHVAALFSAGGLGDIAVHRDLDGRNRVVGAVLPAGR